MSDWTFTGWWRVLLSNGILYCETSDYGEAREALKKYPDGKIQALYSRTQFEWRD